MSFTFTTTNSYDQAGPIGGGAIAPGWYAAMVLEATETTSKSSGNPMLDMTLQVTVSRTRTVDIRHCCLVLTSKAAWKIEQFLAATGKQFAKGEEVSISAQAVEGKKLWVRLYNEADREDPERLYARVDAYMRKEDVPHPGAMTEEEKEEHGLTSRGVKKTIRDAVRETAQSNYERGKQNAAKLNAAISGKIPYEDDEDIPF